MKDNSVPLHRLPECVSQHLSFLAGYRNGNEEMLFATFLSVASICLGQSISLKVSSDWQLKANLWVALVADSGWGKTPTINHIFAPIREFEREYYENYQKEVSDYQAGVQSGEDGLKKPQLSRIIVDDVTPEARLEIMARTSAGIISIRDELLSMVYDGKRYGGTSSSRKSELSLFSGQPYTVSRKNAEDLHASNPFMSVIGGIQPGVFRELASKESIQEGFIARFIFAAPMEPKFKSDITVDNPYKEEYSAFVKKLFRFNRDNNGKAKSPIEFSISESAKSLVNQYIEDNNKLKINPEINDILKGFYGKRDQYFVKFALILGVIRVCKNGGQSLLLNQDFEGAAEIVSFFENNLIRLLPSSDDVRTSTLDKLIVELKKEKAFKKAVKRTLELGCNQKELSRLTKVPQSTLSGWKGSNNR